MKNFLMCLAILSITSVATADSTTDALNASLVEDSITLSLGTDNSGASIINYRIDSNQSPKSANGLHFRSNGEIAIQIGNFNPLTEKWVVASKPTPDPSFTAIKGFLDDLTALQESLTPVAPAASSDAAPPAGGSSSPEPSCVYLAKLISEAHKDLKATLVTPSDLTSMVSEAQGLAGVKTSASRLNEKQDALTKNVESLRAKLAEIRKLFGGLDGNPEKNCPNINSRILIDYVEVHSTAEQIIAKRESLGQQLAKLSKILEPYRDANKWRGPTQADYAIHSVSPTFAELQKVTASAQKTTIALAGNTIEEKTGTAVVAEMDVRRNSLLVAERAVAVLYNSLTYPEYGTETLADGKMVVRRVDDHEPISGAIMLNLIKRTRSPSVAYPFLQFGVSSAKEFPGLLTGIGVRFVDPFSFSISAGGMITRYKDLDGSLKEGDVVSGNAQIKEHLEDKNSDVALYLAFQLKF